MSWAVPRTGAARSKGRRSGLVGRLEVEDVDDLGGQVVRARERASRLEEGDQVLVLAAAEVVGEGGGRGDDLLLADLVGRRGLRDRGGGLVVRPRLRGEDRGLEVAHGSADVGAGAGGGLLVLGALDAAAGGGGSRTDLWGLRHGEEGLRLWKAGKARGLRPRFWHGVDRLQGFGLDVKRAFVYTLATKSHRRIKAERTFLII